MLPSIVHAGILAVHPASRRAISGCCSMRHLTLVTLAAACSCAAAQPILPATSRDGSAAGRRQLRCAGLPWLLHDQALSDASQMITSRVLLSSIPWSRPSRLTSPTCPAMQCEDSRPTCVCPADNSATQLLLKNSLASAASFELSSASNGLPASQLMRAVESVVTEAQQSITHVPLDQSGLLDCSDACLEESLKVRTAPSGNSGHAWHVLNGQGASVASLAPAGAEVRSQRVPWCPA